MAQVGGGIKFVQGTGTDDASIVVEGQLETLNAALAGLQYRSATTVYGLDTVRLFVSDQGHSGSGGAKTTAGTVALELTVVSDAPVVHVGNNTEVKQGEGTGVTVFSK